MLGTSKSVAEAQQHEANTLEGGCPTTEDGLEMVKSKIRQDIGPLIEDIVSYTCNGTPGWRQVVFIDMTDTSYNCPPGLSLTSYSKRTCGRAHSLAADCSSTTFSVGGSEYSRVCGRIKGYQVGNTAAFSGSSYTTEIDNQYVDGVSLTHGPDGGRQNIWTFAAGLTEKINVYTPETNACPCDNSTLGSPPFVGDDYFCESGTNRLWTGDSFYGEFFPDDPLWDGQGCSSSSTCCQLNNPPWFTKNLPNSTTDDIDLRVCISNSAPDSDVPLELIELYIQ